MSIHSRSVNIPWVAFLFAILGLAWCGYVAFPTTSPAPCATSGCLLFQDMRVLGVSLWWVGGGYFFVLALVCLRGKHLLAWWLARLALIADTILLGIMFFTASCADCLVVACFFALTAFFLRPTRNGWFAGIPKRLIILPIWFGLFLGNGISLISERIPLWSINHKENSAVRVFFSPSCPACRDALVALGATAALFPVEEKPGDAVAIHRLEMLLSMNVPMEEALRRSLNPEENLPALSFGNEALLRVRLLRTKAALLHQGFTSLPLIQINGMPQSWRDKLHNTPLNMSAPPSPPPAALDSNAITPHGNGTTQSIRPAGAADENALWDVDVLGQCKQNSSIPCPQ